MATVAVVDDDRRVADGWSEELSRAGHSVKTFYLARAALDGLAADPPEVLVVDHELKEDMPELDGWELVRKLRMAWGPQEVTVRVIMVSAVRTDAVDEAMAVGALARIMHQA